MVEIVVSSLLRERPLSLFVRVVLKGMEATICLLFGGRSGENQDQIFIDIYDKYIGISRNFSSFRSDSFTYVGIR